MKAYRVVVAWISAIPLVLGISGCMSEANFQLASESRLPRWFEVPENSSRADYTVTLDTYVYSHGPESVFKIFAVEGTFSSEEITGAAQVIIGSPRNPPVYAAYTFNGVTDVVEHRDNEPVFYMCDDPAIWKSLGLTFQPAPNSRAP